MSKPLEAAELNYIFQELETTNNWIRQAKDLINQQKTGKASENLILAQRTLTRAIHNIVYHSLMPDNEKEC